MSCTAKTGIKELHHILKTDALKQKLLTELIPGSWQNLANYITKERQKVRGVCLCVRARVRTRAYTSTCTSHKQTSTRTQTHKTHRHTSTQAVCCQKRIGFCYISTHSCMCVCVSPWVTLAVSPNTHSCMCLCLPLYSFLHVCLCPLILTFEFVSPLILTCMCVCVSLRVGRRCAGRCFSRLRASAACSRKTSPRARSFCMMLA